MIRPRRYFPWRVARIFFLSHLTVVGVSLLLVAFSLRLHVYESLLKATDVHAGLARFDADLWSLMFTVFAMAALAIAFLAGRHARPLGHLIQRARELRRFDSPNAPDELPDEDEPGEWYDLERALNRIHKDLRQKTHALSREREELSTLIGAVSDAILAIDEDEAPLFFNAQFSHSFPTAGPNQKALSLGETFRVPDVLQGYRDVLKTGERRMVAVTLLTVASGLPRHFSIAIAPLRGLEGETDRQGPVEGAIGIFHDVTELKASEQIRIEFVGNASHELRTPLTNIKGYVDTLRDDIKAQRFDGAGQFIDIISRNVDRLILLVGDLLDLSTLDSGSNLQRTLVSTREVTDSALRQLEAKREARHQLIVTHFSIDSVMADAARVEQVIVNLVHNAIKYCPENSRIDVTWEPARASGGSLLRVKDNGTGIPVEHQPRLFERFYRIDPGRSREQGGTGLGLSIVKHILLQHGGSVRVQSRPGDTAQAGAEFICYFP